MSVSHLTKENRTSTTTVKNTLQIPSITGEQAQALLRVVNPTTLPYTDLQGRTIQLWKYKHILAASVEENGQIIVLSGDRIHNALLPQERGALLLQRLESVGLKKWHFSYMQSTGKIFVWPFLAAEAKDKYETAYRSAINLQHKKEKELTITQIRLRNITKDHFKDGDNGDLIGAKKEARGNVLMRDGKPLLNKFGRPYNHIKEVQEAQIGIKKVIERLAIQLRRNPPPQERARLLQELTVASRLLDYTERFHPSRSMRERSPDADPEIFEERVQHNKLTDSYNASNPNHPVEERGAKGGHIGGIGNEVGIITGLYEDLSSLLEQEHIFFLPAGQENLSIKASEIQRIIDELAVGIYVHNTVPFFSLHFNGDTNMYPVIHPAYQNTYIGYVISMLDYYMKGFLNGGIFEHKFVEKWNRNRNMTDEELRDHIIDVREYCTDNLGAEARYFSIKEMIHTIEFAGIALPTREVIPEDPILKDYSGFRSSFRIISHQDSIQKAENLFVLDGDFEVLYTISPDPTYAVALEKYRQLTGENPPSYRRLEMAYKMMSKQIKEMMPRLPICKKLFESLEVINFFCYYFNTLKQANKIPLLPERSVNTVAYCPPLFPHLPLRAVYREEIQFTMADLFSALSDEGRKILTEDILTNPSGEKAARFLAERIKDHVCRNAKYPMAQAFRQAEKYLDLSLGFLKSCKTVYEKCLKENIPNLNFKIAHWENERRRFVSDYKNYQICEENIKNLYKARAELLSNPFSVISLDAALTLPINSGSILHLYSEHRQNDEKSSQRRIVGGCGVHLERKSVNITPLGTSILDEFGPQIIGLQPGKALSISTDLTSGIAFKVRFTDLPSIGNESEIAASFLCPFSEPKVEAVDNLLNAIRMEDYEQFIKAAESIVDWNFKDNSGVSALHYAAGTSNQKILEYLISKVDSNTRDSQGYTASHYAARAGNLDNLKLLINKNLNMIYAENVDGATPLYTAVQNGQLLCILFLLEMGADPNCKTTQGFNALMCAIHRGFPDVALSLLKLSKIDLTHLLDDRSNALHLAIEVDMPQVVPQMIGKGVDINCARWDGHTPLHLAAKLGRFTIAEMLAGLRTIQLDATLPSGKTALHLAAESDYYLIVDLLVRKGANPAKFGWDMETPLITAARNGSELSALCLLTCIDGLSVPVQNVQTQVVNIKDVYGHTAFTIAANLHTYEIWATIFDNMSHDPSKMALDPLQCLLLLCRGKADPKTICAFIKKHKLTEPDQLSTVLHAAASGGHNAAVSAIMLAFKVEAIADPQGWTIHDYGAKFDHFGLFRELLVENKRNNPSSSLSTRLQALKDLWKSDKRPLLTPAQLESWGMIAAKYGSLNTLKVILKALDERDLLATFGLKLLYAGVHAGQLEATDIIIYSTFEVNKPLDDRGRYAVHIAVMNNDQEMLTLLRERGAKFDVRDKEGLTPLHYAVLYQRDELFTYLVDPKQGLPDGFLPYAVAKGTRTILALIQKQFPDIEIPRPIPNIADFLRDEHPVLNSRKEESRSLWSYLTGNNGLLKQKEGIVSALTEGNKVKFFKLIKGLPLNEPIIYVLPDGEAVALPLLHLIYRLVPKNMNRDEILNTFVRMSGVDINAVDRERRTILHLCGADEELPEFGSSLRHMNVLAPDRNGVTPLHLYARGRHRGHFKAILARVPRNRDRAVDPEDSRMLTPLFYAVYANQIENARDLLKKNSDPNHRSQNLQTPLGAAMAHHSLPLIRLLNSYGADPEAPIGSERISLLHMALAEKSDEIAKWCIENGSISKKDRKGREPIHIAASKGNVRMVRLMHACGASLYAADKKGLTVAHYATRSKSIELVDYLAEMEVPLETTPTTDEQGIINLGSKTIEPMHMAAGEGDSTMLTRLAQMGVNLDARDADNCSALVHATRGGNPEMLKLFSESPLAHEPEQIIRSILMAIQMDTCFQLSTLLPHFGDVNRAVDPANSNLTLLHYAGMTGATHVIRYLLKQGADIERCSYDGLPPFALTVQNNYLEAASIFLSEAEVDVNYKMPRGMTFLHMAAEEVNVSMMALLVIHGAKIDSINDLGWTPLHEAASKNSQAAIRFLLCCGADPNKKTNNGLTAYELSKNQLCREAIASWEKTLSECRQNRESRVHAAIRLNDFYAFAALSRIEGVQQRDNQGRTPFDLATNLGNLPLFRRLLEASSSLEADDSIQINKTEEEKS